MPVSEREPQRTMGSIPGAMNRDDLSPESPPARSCLGLPSRASTT
jgi:hypothetical protein